MISSIHKKIWEYIIYFLLSFKHVLVLVLIVEETNWQQVYSKLQHSSQYRYQQRCSLQSQLLDLRFVQCLFRMIQSFKLNYYYARLYFIFDIFLSSHARSWYLFPVSYTFIPWSGRLPFPYVWLSDPVFLLERSFRSGCQHPRVFYVFFPCLVYPCLVLNKKKKWGTFFWKIMFVD